MVALLLLLANKLENRPFTKLWIVPFFCIGILSDGEADDDQCHCQVHFLIDLLQDAISTRNKEKHQQQQWLYD